jgi:O-antigen ligase
MFFYEPAGSTFFYSFAALLVLAPLYKGGNRPLPLLLIELAAIGFLFAIFAVHRAPITLPRTMWTAIAILFVYPLIQLIPLPQSIWQMLPGHAAYANVFERFAAKDSSGIWRAISVIPGETEAGWLAMFPALACMLAAKRLSPAHAARLLLFMAIFAGLESFLGLLQVGAGGESILYFGNMTAYGAATGTFINRNHLAAMLAMTLPVMVGLLVFSMRPGRRRRQQRVRSEVYAQRAMLFGSAVMVLLCLLLTRSKAGIVTAFVGLVCSAIVLVRARAATEGTSRTRLATFLVIGMVAIATLLAIVIGIAPILERFGPSDVASLSQGRLGMYMATLRAGMEFLPFGSGLSTFADIFPRFQIGNGFGGFVDHAHNEYLQAFMELGVAGVIVVVLLLVVYVSRMRKLLWREGGRSFTLLQLGAGVGMLPMILHSLFDFALHMPANAMWFATLAGVMFHKGVAQADPVEGELRKPPQLHPHDEGPPSEFLLPS